MTLKNMFNTLKQEGIVKQIDQYLILSYKDDLDRRSDINSPSSSLGCVRASFYHKKGFPRKPLNPRLRRIFENGHGVHYRLQKYLKDMGILILKEVPVYSKKYNIQGHTDGLLDLSKIYRKEIGILEIKSINSNGFKELSRRGEPEKSHKAQAQIYLACVEAHRKLLREKYSSKDAMNVDVENRRRFYASLYQHLQNDTFEDGKTREQKINKKVREHFALDDILIDLVKPITKMIILYENKDTQDLKDFIVEVDEELLQETLVGFIKSNIYFKLDVCPPRECEKKHTWCDYADICFDNKIRGEIT